jgi:peptide/nickel transport system permease protein
MSARNSVSVEFLRVSARIIVVIICAGIIGATLIRFAPGFFSDERSLDYRFAPETLEAIRQERAGSGNPVLFYIDFLTQVARGDLGHSMVSGQPVRSLIGRRLPVTLTTVAWGLSVGWTTALLGAAVAALSRRRIPSIGLAFLSGSLLCIPAAVLATLCILLELPPAAAIAAIIFPQVYAHAFAEIRAARDAGHVLAARARGVRPLRRFAFHVSSSAAWPIIALAGVTTTVAFGAAIPVEALTDSPGIGQLAWRAALGRDLPVLVSITLLLAAATTVANGAAELSLFCLRRRWE